MTAKTTNAATAELIIDRCEIAASLIEVCRAAVTNPNPDIEPATLREHVAAVLEVAVLRLSAIEEDAEHLAKVLMTERA